MPGLLYIKTFGCQMNEYDSGKMRDVLETTHGMTRTDNPAEADVLGMLRFEAKPAAEGGPHPGVTRGGIAASPEHSGGFPSGADLLLQKKGEDGLR